MSAPLVVNTTDGTCWKLRPQTRFGMALYAIEGAPKDCPQGVMATYAELVEHGIAGEAFSLPMPVGPQPRPESGSKVAALIGDAKPATDALLVQLGESVRDRLAHDHTTQREDWFCMNLTSFMGERMGPVLRRLVDAEARVAELEAPVLNRGSATTAQIHAYLRTVLDDSVYLRFQQDVATHAMGEAVGDAATVRASADNDGLYGEDWREGWDDAIERMDPDRNDPVPASLIAFADEVPTDGLTALIAPTQVLSEDESGSVS
jgi:hypothetical protein